MVGIDRGWSFVWLAVCVSYGLAFIQKCQLQNANFFAPLCLGSWLGLWSSLCRPLEGTAFFGRAPKLAEKLAGERRDGHSHRNLTL
jgi:hypothetical protein